MSLPNVNGNQNQDKNDSDNNNNSSKRSSAMAVDAQSQAAFKGIFEKFWSRLTTGCGASCNYTFCASNPALKRFHIDPNYLATIAIKLSLSASKSAFDLLSPKPATYQQSANPQFLDLPSLKQIIAECHENNSNVALVRLLGSVFRNSESLNLSFLASPTTAATDGTDFGLNIEEIQEAYRLLGDLPENVLNSLHSAIESIAGELMRYASRLSHPHALRQFIILLESPFLTDPTSYKRLLGPLLVAMSKLPTLHLLQKYYFSRWNDERLREWHASLQNLIALSALELEGEDAEFDPHNEPFVVAATIAIGVVHDINETRHFLGFQDFYSQFINEKMDITTDYKRYFEESSLFTFIDHAYVLNPETKSNLLQIESSVNQRITMNQHMVSRILMGGPINPYLVLRIHRQRLIPTSLDALRHPPEDLKKPLKVQFVGEEGIDEGGVKKEWFQLLVKELFSPMYGMFTVDHATRTQWFNPASEDFSEFELLGKVLGLAVYNSVILDLHFPRLVYKKLLGGTATLEDLSEINPGLAKGLKQLLEYKETDDETVEELFGLNFRVSYEVYGHLEAHDLIPNGSEIPVTAANRQQYADAYVKFLLSDSIDTQFEHFRRGFVTVCDSPIFRLFRYEELELLICGSPVLDFEELEASTQYEGYTKDDITIKNFWTVIHEMTLEQKKKFLFFTTGTDRAPIGGLGRIGFVISRHGEENRLPASHTCFSVLVLPPTPSLEKMRTNMHIVIQNAEGFGMI